MTNNYVLITAPHDPKLPGRKKGWKKSFNRIKGKVESPIKKGKQTEIQKLDRKGRIMHCKKCKGAGHNSAGCKKFPKQKKENDVVVSEGGYGAQTITQIQPTQETTQGTPHD